MRSSAALICAELSAEEWTALAAWATFVVLAVTATLAAIQVREQFRPWVTVSLHFRSNIAFIAVRNLGNRAARDVRLGFEPELATTLTEHGGLESVAMLAESTPVLVPGEERLILLDRTSDRLGSVLPQRHTAHVQYRDGRRNLSERFVLSFDLLEGARLPDKGLHDLVGEVAAIREHLVGPEGN